MYKAKNSLTHSLTDYELSGTTVRIAMKLVNSVPLGSRRSLRNGFDQFNPVHDPYP